MKGVQQIWNYNVYEMDRICYIDEVKIINAIYNRFISLMYRHLGIDGLEKYFLERC